MSLYDQMNLAAQPVFQSRVAAAAVHTALAVGSEAINNVQTIAFTGTVTGGTFALTYAGQTTPAQPFNVSAAALQVALQALSTIGANNCVVTGGPGPTAFVVTFTGTLGYSPHAAFTFNAASLTGTTPGMTVTQTTAGASVALHSARQVLATKVLNGTGPAMSLGVADNATVQADFNLANGSYQPLGGAIANATNANPIVFTTSAPHKLANGQLVNISGVLGNTAANGNDLAVTVVSSTTFSIAVAGNGAYTSGGTFTVSETQIGNDIQFQMNSMFNAYM